MRNIWSWSSYWLNPHAIPVAVAAIAAVVTGIVMIVRERATKESVLFLQMAVAVFVWLGSSAILYCSRSPEIAEQWARNAYLGVPFIPATVFGFTRAMLRIERWRWLAGLCWGLSLLFLVVVQRSDLILSGVTRLWWGYYYRYAWPGVAGIAFISSALFICTLFFLREYRGAPPGSARKLRSKSLCIAFFAVSFAPVDFFGNYGIPVYPAGFAFIYLFIFLLARGVVRHHLIDLTPAFAADKILATMQGAVLVADPEGKIRVANRTASTMLGYHDGGLLGQPVTQIFESPRGETRATFQERATTWRTRSGQPVAVTVSAALLRDRRDHPVGVVYVAADITALKRAEGHLEALNATLEERVAERSVALEQRADALEWALRDRERTAEELRQAYDELQRTQKQLLHSEKIAAIGQLAAGVAHEINNPIAYVRSNLETLREFTEQLAGTLTEYALLTSAAVAHQASALTELERFNASLKEGEIDYMLRELPEMLSEMLDGVDRVKTIVANLRAFAHPGGKERLPVDIAEQLERALSLVWNELKYNCTVHKDLEPMPPVPGNSSELVQVFVNLLLNAKHAIQDKGQINIRGDRQTGRRAWRSPARPAGSGSRPASVAWRYRRRRATARDSRARRLTPPCERPRACRRRRTPRCGTRRRQARRPAPSASQRRAAERSRASA